MSHPPPTVPGMADLTDDDRALLTFAGRLYRQSGAREQAIRDELGLTGTRYHQRLDQLLDRPEALVVEPMLVRRLRRIRDDAQRRRRARAG